MLVDFTHWPQSESVYLDNPKKKKIQENLEFHFDVTSKTSV